MGRKENNDNLYQHVSKLCEILNKNNIKKKVFNGSDHTLIEWKANAEQPSATFLGGICRNPTAFDFIKKNGFIDNGVCWHCGAEPIKNDYTFTDAFNKNVKFFICKSCYFTGNKIRQKSHFIVLILKLFFYSFVIYLLIKFFALIF